MNSLKNYRSFLSFTLPLALACGLLITALTGDRVNENLEDSSEKGEKPGADEWFIEQRAYPLNEIPVGAHLQSLEQLSIIETRRAVLMRRLYGITAEAFEQKFALQDGERLRRIRVIRDYGMFDRREAPQYYPEITRSLGSHP